MSDTRFYYLQYYFTDEFHRHPHILGIDAQICVQLKSVVQINELI